MADRKVPLAAPGAVVARPGVLSLNIREKAALYAAYMPFLKGGGIFIPTSRQYALGEEVFMLLSLHVVEMFLWAAALVYSGLVPDWRAAGFFAGNTYTTVGYGNFILPDGWRMLAPIIAMSGLFTFGWSGSVLVDFVRRLNTIRAAAVNPKSRPADAP